MDWDNFRSKESKYKPKVGDEEDCSRFDKFEEEEPFYPPEERRNRKQRKDINFVGYTYKKDVEEQKTKLVQALNETLNTDFTGSSADIASEEGPKPMMTNDSTPKNKSNFY